MSITLLFMWLVRRRWTGTKNRWTNYDPTSAHSLRFSFAFASSLLSTRPWTLPLIVKTVDSSNQPEATTSNQEKGVGSNTILFDGFQTLCRLTIRKRKKDKTKYLHRRHPYHPPRQIKRQSTEKGTVHSRLTHLAHKQTCAPESSTATVQFKSTRQKQRFLLPGSLGGLIEWMNESGLTFWNSNWQRQQSLREIAFASLYWILE